MRKILERKAMVVISSLAVLIILLSPFIIFLLMLLLPLFLMYWLFSNHINRILKDAGYAIERDITMADRNPI
jgi:hypothetical protein